MDHAQAHLNIAKIIIVSASPKIMISEKWMTGKTPKHLSTMKMLILIPNKNYNSLLTPHYDTNQVSVSSKTLKLIIII